jgi:hypothetical protein
VTYAGTGTRVAHGFGTLRDAGVCAPVSYTRRSRAECVPVHRRPGRPARGIAGDEEEPPRLRPVRPRVTTADPTATASPFSQTGELAWTMAELDWAATAVGPPEAWPEALCGMVRVLLTSRFPMWMAWGDELTMFYNGAYQRILQAKYPWALGRPAREVWA